MRKEINFSNTDVFNWGRYNHSFRANSFWPQNVHTTLFLPNFQASAEVKHALDFLYLLKAQLVSGDTSEIWENFAAEVSNFKFPDAYRFLTPLFFRDIKLKWSNKGETLNWWLTKLFFEGWASNYFNFFFGGGGGSCSLCCHCSALQKNSPRQSTNKWAGQCSDKLHVCTWIFEFH